jgi:hypothetical protein
MHKKLRMNGIILAALAAFLPAVAEAATLTFPINAPVASMEIPDSWKPHETATGIDAVSPDDAVYLSIDVAAASETEKVVQNAVTFLKTKGVTADTSTAEQTDDTLNGMQMSIIDMNGSDQDGAVSVSLAAVSINEKTNLVITYWGTKGAEDKDQDQIVAIFDSLKPAEH